MMTEDQPQQDTTDDLYFFLQGEFVKIGRGRTSDRLKTLQTGNPNKIDVLIVIPGAGWAEKIYHTLFSQYRVMHGGKEWFEFSEEIREEVKRLSRESPARLESRQAKQKTPQAVVEKRQPFNIQQIADDCNQAYLDGVINFDCLSRILLSFSLPVPDQQNTAHPIA